MLTALPGSVSAPMQIANAHDGSSRLFVVEQAGTIRIYKNGALLPTPFLDIHTLVTCCGEQGLLSVAFHPDYASNGYFYVYYINKLASPGDITIARYSVSADPDVADPASAQILLVVPHPTNSNHNGGQLYFGPVDGYLYAGTGDGGGGGDQPNNAQNTDILLGKMLRIDVNGTGAVPCGQSTPTPYAIPASNPFAGSPSDCHEIWAYGMRNPWRFSFDRVTGDLLIGDVGQELYEEIDFQPAASAGGENYGWHKMEGFHCYNPSTNCNDGTLDAADPRATAQLRLVRDHRRHALPRDRDPGARRHLPLLGQLPGRHLFGDAGGRRELDHGAAQVERLQRLRLRRGRGRRGVLRGPRRGQDLPDRSRRPTRRRSPRTSCRSSVIAGDPDFTLTVNGSGFVYGSVVRWNGADRPTTLISASQLKAAIPASDIAVGGHGVRHGLHAGAGRRHLGARRRSTSTRRSSTCRSATSRTRTSRRSTTPA